MRFCSALFPNENTIIWALSVSFSKGENDKIYVRMRKINDMRILGMRKKDLMCEVINELNKQWNNINVEYHYNNNY